MNKIIISYHILILIIHNYYSVLNKKWMKEIYEHSIGIELWYNRKMIANDT
jgi:hypothetical protein